MPQERLYFKNAPQRWLSVNEGIKRALAVIISWNVNKKGARKKSQEIITSNFVLWNFSKKSNKRPGC